MVWSTSLCPLLIHVVARWSYGLTMLVYGLTTMYYFHMVITHSALTINSSKIFAYIHLPSLNYDHAEGGGGGGSITGRRLLPVLYHILH